ncbi:hypothetical protein I7I48_07301 [Histoplasma ohiense]|nr:hypothetical protein I7I48_07301 [Histoplasma ohiense (nom. inval.)]
MRGTKCLTPDGRSPAQIFFFFFFFPQTPFRVSRKRHPATICRCGVCRVVAPLANAGANGGFGA